MQAQSARCHLCCEEKRREEGGNQFPGSMTLNMGPIVGQKHSRRRTKKPATSINTISALVCLLSPAVSFGQALRPFSLASLPTHLLTPHLPLHTHTHTHTRTLAHSWKTIAGALPACESQNICTPLRGSCIVTL